MQIGRDEIWLLQEVLSPEQKEMFPIFAKAAEAGIAGLEMTGRVIGVLLPVLSSINLAGMPRPRRKKLQRLVQSLQEEQSRLERQGIVEEKLPALQDLEKAIAGRVFESRGELDAFMERWNEKANDRPQPGLGNLTPKQLDDLFQKGWWSEGCPVRLSADIPADEAAGVPLVHNVRLLLKALLDQGGGKGVKVTAKGNLPRTIIDAVRSDLIDPFGFDTSSSKRKERLYEEDLPGFSLQRDIALVAGLTSQERGVLRISEKGMAALDRSVSSGLLVRLFDLLFHGFDLSIFDGYQPVPNFDYLLPYSLWRISTLKSDGTFTQEELAAICLHPKFRSDHAKPFFPGSSSSTAEFLAFHRLLRPLLWLGCLLAIPEEGRSWFHRYRVSALFKRLYQAPGLPTG